PGYSEFQDRFDWAGTFDPSAWFTAGAAIQWMENLLPGGWPALRKANSDLILRARKVLADKLGLELPCPASLLGSMATLPLPQKFQGHPKTSKIDVEQLRLYDEFRIEVPFFHIGQPERRYFRISAQIYNCLAEYEYLSESLG